MTSLEGAGSTAMNGNTATKKLNLFKLIQNRSITTQFPQKQFINQKLDSLSFTFQTELVGHTGCVNAINFSNDGKWLCSGGDDTSVFVWNVMQHCFESGGKKLPPNRIFKGGHSSNIFCTVFDCEDRHILSCGNDSAICRYDMNSTRSTPVQSFFNHQSSVRQVSASPKDANMFVSAGDDRRVFLFDVRTERPQAKMINSTNFNSIMYHPKNENHILTADGNSKILLFDTRKMTKNSTVKENLHEYVLPYKRREDIWDAVFNQQGTRIACTIRRGPLYVFDTDIHDKPIYQLSDPRYVNGCTVKHVSFAGPDQNWVCSGTDDWKIHAWKIPDFYEKGETAENIETVHKRASDHMLVGHRSNANNIKCHPYLPLLCSSGVEKIVKCWSVLGEDNTTNRKPRPLYINTIGNMPVMADNDEDEETESTAESKSTLAYFDYLNAMENLAAQRRTEVRSRMEEDDSEDDEDEDVVEIGEDDDEEVELTITPALLSRILSNPEYFMQLYEMGRAAEQEGDEDQDMPLEEDDEEEEEEEDAPEVQTLRNRGQRNLSRLLMQTDDSDNEDNNDEADEDQEQHAFEDVE